ncbi:MAG: hypothetical protein H7A52_19115, partial [Akkermansiaceae bacterium]|nr:hypothetical protein [Akkermansiaceae bacterium]
MKRFLPLVFVVPVVAAAVPFARAEPPEWSGNPDKTIVVRTLPGMMRYDTTDIAVPPGARVKLTLENPDDLQHNLVILKPDAKDKDGQKFAQEAWLLGEEGIKLGWVPRDHPRILVAARLLDPKAGEDLYFVAPAEAGDYPFICTVPGHSMLMRGTLHIRSETKLLEDLSYSIYEGNWDKLPDFSKLTAVETGKLPGGLVTLQVAKKRKGGFGIVFEGRLKVTRAEKFEFFLDSDDGSRLIIDGEGTVDRDGVHPDGSPNKGEETLQEGEHGFRLLYFEKSGNRGLSLAAKSKSLGEVALSESVLKKKAARPEPDPILLT